MLGEAADLDDAAQDHHQQSTAAPVRLSDVALVEDGFEDITSLARSNGGPVQAMGILKQRGSNAVSVAKAVTAALAERAEGAARRG